jgi:pilus assembly protein CpaC
MIGRLSVLFCLCFTALAAEAGEAPLGDIVHVAAGQSTEIDLPADVHDVMVGNPDIADVVLQSRRRIHIVGRAAGQTNVVLDDSQGNAIRRLQIDVALDTVAVRDALRRVLPDERGLSVEAVNDSLYLLGSARSDGAAEMARNIARRFVASDANLVNSLKVSNDQQVLLHVKVAEIQRTVLKELGVGLATTKPIPLFGKSVQLSGATSPTNGLIDASTGAIYGAASFTGIGSLVTNLNMLENQGLIRTLVEPNLTAVSGETATMLAGGEIPIPVSQVNGAITVEFKPYGVLMNFTPTVLDAGRLSLKMSTEVSAIDKANATALGPTISVPALTVRRASSTVELPSGGSLMIAGLLQNDITSAIAGLPGLMDLPVLGRLFRSDSFQRNESEMVVILSAYIVQPTETPDALAAPTDGFAPSSDLKRFLLGRLQDTYTRKSAAGAVPPPQLQGPYGYVIQ